MFSTLLKIVQFEVKGQPVIINFFNTDVIFIKHLSLGCHFRRLWKLFFIFCISFCSWSIAQQQQTLHLNSFVLYNILWTFFPEILCSKNLHSGYLSHASAHTVFCKLWRYSNFFDSEFNKIWRSWILFSHFLQFILA